MRKVHVWLIYYNNADRCIVVIEPYVSNQASIFYQQQHKKTTTTTKIKCSSVCVLWIVIYIEYTLDVVNKSRSVCVCVYLCDFKYVST